MRDSRRYFRIGGLVLLASLPNGAAFAQARVAPPTAVESAPLSPPPGASPVQMPSSPVQAPPAPVPDSRPGPQPVQPAPPPPNPVVPQPVQPAPTLPGPVEPQPVQPPPTLPPPGQPAPPPQQTGLPDPNATLAGKRGDASDIDEVALAAKPVLLLSGQTSWDQGFQKLSESFTTLRAEAQKAGLPVAGRPLSLFVETTDDGFRFEAMLPVAVGGQVPAFGGGVKLSASPSGKALRFLHVAPYDDIDSTYETITAYLEAKSISVKDAFLEEYVSDLKDPGDPNLEINVYVQPK